GRGLVLARDRRRARQPQRAPDLHVGRADAERGEPDAGLVRTDAQRPGRPGAGVLLDGRGGGGGGRRPRDHRVDLPAASHDRRRRGPGDAVVGALAPHAVGTLWLIPALPLAGAAVNLVVGNRLGRWAGVLATALVFASFGVSVAAVLNLLT